MVLAPDRKAVVSTLTSHSQVVRDAQEVKPAQNQLTKSGRTAIKPTAYRIKRTMNNSSNLRTDLPEVI